MTTLHFSKSPWGAAMALALVCAGCASAEALVVQPTTPAKVDHVLAPTLSKHSYKRILVLPPERQVQVANHALPDAVRARGMDFYISKIERDLLASGFQVIAPEVVQGGKKNSKRKTSAVARALAMGKETHSHAVLIIKKLRVVADANYYHGEDNALVEEQDRNTDDDGNPVHRETEECLYKLPYYALTIEAKLVDVTSGDLLWMGDARSTTLDTLKDAWAARLDSDCNVEAQAPFIYEDELASEGVLERTANGMVNQLLSPMKKLALAGAPIQRAAPKNDDNKKAKPKEKLNLVRVAVVTRSRAPLRGTPSRRGRRIRRVPRKTKVEVTESMGEWHKVRVQDGSVGWMHERSIILSEDVKSGS